jgi:uncharacterized RDD family membrane protein YckC
MQCLSCQTVNEDGEERCVRCGRRLHPASPRPGPDPLPLQAATAPALEALPGGARAERAALAVAAAGSQQPLFREALGSSKVIPIPTLTPLRAAREGNLRRTHSRHAASRPVRRPSDFQQSLSFQEAGEGVAYTPPGETIYCDAPVAPPAHRLMAAAVDASLILVAAGLFLVVFILSGADLVLDRQTLSLLGGAAAVISLFYRALWCLAGGDTPGMRFAGLRLVDFDGRKPSRDQRGLRQVASLLSLLSAGLGLVWTLVDEESLAWHDHISKTFPTAV